MVLLYIGVGIVITGILLILYSEFFENIGKNIGTRIPHDRYDPNLDNHFNERKVEPQRSPLVSDKDSFSDLPDIDIKLEDTITDIKEEITESKLGKEPELSLQDKKEYNVVLYIDNSGTIGSLSDGLTSNDWSFLTRIGIGTLLYKQHGINITINNKLYRYDFYRIASLKAHDNYMLFTLKGKQSVNCIVLHEESDILYDIEKEYQNFISM